MNSHQFIVAAEVIGFISGLALSIQSVRLVNHLRVASNLRKTAKRTSGKTSDLALQGAEALEKAIAQWDAFDQVMVIIGFCGLTISFLFKIAGLMLE